jgi:hypothetical protein
VTAGRYSNKKANNQTTKNSKKKKKKKKKEKETTGYPAALVNKRAVCLEEQEVEPVLHRAPLL